MKLFYQPEKADSREDNNLVSVNIEDMSTAVEDGAITCKFTEVRRYQHSVTIKRAITPTTEWKVVEEASAGEGYFPPQWGKLTEVKQSSASEDSFRDAKMVIDGNDVIIIVGEDSYKMTLHQTPRTDWRMDINVPKGFFPAEWGELKYWTESASGLGADFVFENKTINIKNIVGYVTERHNEDVRKLLADPKVSDDRKAWLSAEINHAPWPILIEKDGKLICFSKYLEEEDFFYYTGENGVEGFYRINNDHTANSLRIGRGNDEGFLF